MQDFAQRPVNIGDNSLPMESNLVSPGDPNREKPNKTGVLYRFSLRAVFLGTRERDK